MLTTIEVAAFLSEKWGTPVRVETVQQWCKRGRMPGAVSIGGRIWQIPRETVEHFEPLKLGRRPKQAE